MPLPRHASRGRRLVAIGAALAAAVAITPAVAAAAPEPNPAVHLTPKLPIVVDGVEYASSQIHRFDGRALYRYVPSNGKKVIAFTHLARYKAFLHTVGVRLPTPGEAQPRTAHAAYAGQDALLCTDPIGTCLGPNYDLVSGRSISDLRSISGYFYDGFRAFANTITRIDVHNYARVVAYDLPNFDPRGGVLTIGNVPSATYPLTAFGWGNRIESIYVAW